MSAPRFIPASAAVDAGSLGEAVAEASRRVKKTCKACVLPIDGKSTYCNPCSWERTAERDREHARKMSRRKSLRRIGERLARAQAHGEGAVALTRGELEMLLRVAAEALDMEAL